MVYFSIDNRGMCEEEEWPLLLSFDEQLLTKTSGLTDDRLERALQEFGTESAIWGVALDSQAFLLEQDQAETFCFSLLKHYWGNVNLFSYDSFHEAHFNVEVVNEKIQHFFDAPENKKALFAFIHKKEGIHFAQLVEFLFTKSIQTPVTETGLERVYVYRVGQRFFVQPIYSERVDYWETIAAKKMYALLLQQPLVAIERPLQLMRLFQEVLLRQFSKNRVATMIHKMVQQLDFENPKSYVLKQLHLLNIEIHFSSGRRHLKKLRKCIAQVQAEWEEGPFALNEKEQTLLSYMLFQEAITRQDNGAIIQHGLYLVEEERLFNHAIELVVDYEDVLPSMNPQPQALVKNYHKNYVEHLFFVLLDTLVKEGQWEDAVTLLKNYELASCTAIFELLQEQNPEMLHLIEATVQQDIAVLVDGTTQIIRESLVTWQTSYAQKKSPYYDIALQTSQHMCNLLQILFIAEQDLLVEKLLAVYKKYMRMPAHFEHLRQFIEQRTAMLA